MEKIHNGTLWGIPPFRKARKRQCQMARQRGPRKVPVEKSHFWDIAIHSVFATQISFCAKGSPWNPLGHPPFSESTQTPVSGGPATGAQKSFCGKEPPWNPLGHRKTLRFRGPDKFLRKRATMESSAGWVPGHLTLAFTCFPTGGTQGPHDVTSGISCERVREGTDASR